MYKKKIVGSLSNAGVPSGVIRFIASGEIDRSKWRFKFWKRWLFNYIFVEWFGLVKRIDRIEPEHSRILWINLAAPSLGDSLMDLSARPLLAGRTVDLLSHPKNVGLYHDDLWFRNVSADATDFKQMNYDLILCDAFSPRVLIQKLMIAPFTPYLGLYEFVNGFEVHRTYFAFARMIELLDLNNSNRPIRPTISACGRANSEKDKVDVCIAVGGEWPFRTYVHWIEVTRWLIERGYSVSLVGSANGEFEASRILEAFPSVRSTVGTLSLNDVVFEIAKAKIFIGADGGLWHIACAIPMPTIVLFADCQIFDGEGNRVTRETADMVCETIYDDFEVSNIAPVAITAAFETLSKRVDFEL